MKLWVVLVPPYPGVSAKVNPIAFLSQEPRSATDREQIRRCVSALEWRLWECELTSTADVLEYVSDEAADLMHGDPSLAELDPDLPGELNDEGEE